MPAARPVRGDGLDSLHVEDDGTLDSGEPGPTARWGNLRGLTPASRCRRSDAATVLRDTRWPSARGGPTGGYFDDDGPISW
jgi:hypothetical protein